MKPTAVRTLELQPINVKTQHSIFHPEAPKTFKRASRAGPFRLWVGCFSLRLVLIWECHRHVHGARAWDLAATMVLRAMGWRVQRPGARPLCSRCVVRPCCLASAPERSNSAATRPKKLVGSSWRAGWGSIRWGCTKCQDGPEGIKGALIYPFLGPTIEF